LRRKVVSFSLTPEQESRVIKIEKEDIKTQKLRDKEEEKLLHMAMSIEFDKIEQSMKETAAEMSFEDEEEEYKKKMQEHKKSDAHKKEIEKIEKKIESMEKMVAEGKIAQDELEFFAMELQMETEKLQMMNDILTS